MDPPFQAEHCMQKQDSQQLTEVQQSVPATVALAPVLSVQSSCKQIRNLNLQVWCMQQHCTKSGRGSNFSCASRTLFNVDPLLIVLDLPLLLMNWVRHGLVSLGM